MEERDDEVIEQIAQALRNEPMRRLSPSFDARVMASIRWSERPTGARALAAWLVRPHRLAISPLGGLAAAAAFLALAYVGAGSAVREMVRQVQIADGRAAGAAGVSVATTTVVAADGKQLVQFVLVAPDAKSVSVVGDFNDWSATATPLRSTSGNLWTVQVPLTPGRYNYIFMVDGSKIVSDPAAPKSPADEFGERSSVITVGGSAS